jgi:6-phosphogluconolactonase
MTKHLTLLVLAAAALAACEQDRSISDPAQASVAAPAFADGGNDAGAVYTLTNETTGNAVAVFARAADGTLSPMGRVATGGTGTGDGLGSQGAVVLSGDGRWLFAVNAGSNDVSAFRVGPQGLSLASRTASGGTLPISLTVRGDVLYVLNAGGAGNITGFRVRPDGELAAIAGATRPLSGSGVGPAEVAFSPDGRSLVVTEKATNLLDIYAIDEDGVASGPRSVTSAGGTPFGFAFGQRNLLFVTEAADPGSASSYILDRDGDLRLVSGVVLTHQGAPCWAVVTSDGRLGFTGNGAGSVSAFTIGRDGSLSLLASAAATITDGVNDIALSADSRYLYVLQVGGTPAVHAFRVQEDGSLTSLGTVGGLPAGTRGLAAR